jgi:hypothetical protein
LAATSSLLYVPNAEAVPSYTRRYGFACSSCHTMWGALNGAGITFRLSGYRAMFGKDLVPIEENKDIRIPGVNVVLPSTLPLSFVTGGGFDQRTEKRTAFDGTTTKRGASSLALEDASIFLTGPMGDHFSAFVEFPMYETKAWEFTPTGPSGPSSDPRVPGGANEPFKIPGFTNPTGNFQFVNEKPVFEVAKFFWNNLLGDSLPRDSFNALFGITHMPLPYASGKVRLSVNQYLIYERRAVDLISPVHPTLMGNADELFRLGEPQILAEFFGMIVPGKDVTATASKETLWFEYHLGVTNGSNDNTDNNKSKDMYGRFVARYYMSSLGVFGFHSPDTYGSGNRLDPAFQIGTNGTAGCVGTWAPGCGGIYNPVPGSPGFNGRNAATAVGVDGTLNLTPFINIPISIDNQYMWRNETNPTGFNTQLKWTGGFHQVNWFLTPQLVAYGRYDWIKGKPFNDTPFGGITFSHPSEHDIVAGIQYAVFENVKLIGEARHHIFKDDAIGGFVVNAGQPFVARTTPAKLVDDGFTARLMMGF